MRSLSFTFCAALLCSLSAALPAKANFVGYYDLTNFQLVNTNADGTVTTPDSGVSVVLTGGNNGSGNGGTTDLIINAAAAGLVQFQYSYAADDTPGYDWTGYLLNGSFIQLTDTDGNSGNVTFTVAAGESFGFRVGTADNTGEPGIVTVSSFSAPAGSGTGVPEPGTLSMVLLAAAAAAMMRKRIGRATNDTEEKA